MLRDRGHSSLVLCGEVVCLLDPVAGYGPDDEPVTEIDMIQAMGFSKLAPGDQATVTTRVTPMSLEFSRWTFFTPSRPDGWPR